VAGGEAPGAALTGLPVSAVVPPACGGELPASGLSAGSGQEAAMPKTQPHTNAGA
jgi:hypothetical protein